MKSLEVPSALDSPRSTLRIAWILGWAVPEGWFAPLARAAFPGATHTFFPAAPDTVEKLRTAGPFDWLVGHSLGAQLLLAAGPRLGRVALLAPIYAFPREAGTGGRTALTQVKYLARWLRRDRPAALADFYQRAGLDVPAAAAAELPLETLLWGLAQLETIALAPAMPPAWRAWCGADDPLLDAARLHALVPEIMIVPGATHHPAGLIKPFASEVERVDPNALPGSAAESALGSTRSTSPSTVVADSFSRAAPGYDRHALVQLAMAEWLAEWLPTERNGRVLEVGAGTGLFTRHLAGWRDGVTATDLSPAMTQAGRAAVPAVSWRMMEAGHPLPGPWDWIFSSAMLQWVEDPAQVFSAWRKVLKPGHQSLVGSPSSDNPSCHPKSGRPLDSDIPQSAIRIPHSQGGRIVAGLFIEGSLPEWRAVAGEDAPLVWRTAAEWRAGLVRAGFHIARDESVTKVFLYPSALNFLRSLHGVGAAPDRRFTSGVLRQKLHDYGTRFSDPVEAGVRATWIFYRFEAIAAG